mgnify:CR=1 FL=1
MAENDFENQVEDYLQQLMFIAPLGQGLANVGGQDIEQSLQVVCDYLPQV